MQQCKEKGWPMGALCQYVSVFLSADGSVGCGLQAPAQCEHQHNPDDPQPTDRCKRQGGCVCGGDVPQVRAGCSQWKGD